MNRPTIMIDSQLLNTFQDCPCKFYYQYVVNARTLFKGEALDKGDLLHHMMKFHYKMMKHNQLLLTNPDKRVKAISYKDIMDICIRKAEKHLLKLDLDIDLGLEVIRTYKEYASYYRGENWQILEIERPFAKVLYEDESIKIVYCGIIDLLIHLGIVDHKSSSRRGIISGLSNQFMGYAWAFNSHNVIINKIGFQKTLKAEEKFERQTQSYPQDILDEWRENTIRTAFKMYDSLMNIPKLMVDRNFTACDKYAGCPFQEVCQTIPEAREFKIQQKYQLVPAWTPMKGISVK